MVDDGEDGQLCIAVTPAEMEATVGMDGAVSHRGDCG